MTTRCERRRGRRPAALAAGLAALLLAAPAGAEVIDRILAVVNGSIITLSDVRAAQRFELIPPEVTTDPVAAGLQRLIDRRLMLAEVERYAPPEPDPAAIDAALAAVRARFPDALALETELVRYGLSHEELRGFLRDTLRLRAYLDQRFASTSEPSEAEVLRYYQDHEGDFAENGKARPYDAAREQARAALIGERRAALVEEWVDGLRRRAALVIVYLPGR